MRIVSAGRDTLHYRCQSIVRDNLLQLGQRAEENGFLREAHALIFLK
jgi:hypothetical protein